MWLEFDELGRPRCEHGWARKAWKGRYRCRHSHDEAQRRYRATDKGRETARRYNHSPHARSCKHIYDLTRVR